MTTIVARNKFRCSKVEHFEAHDGPYENVYLHAQYIQGNKDDLRFSRWTPSGSMEFSVSNPNILGKFEVGKAYYIDLRPVDEAEVEDV